MKSKIMMIYHAYSRDRMVYSFPTLQHPYTNKKERNFIHLYYRNGSRFQFEFTLPAFIYTPNTKWKAHFPHSFKHRFFLLSNTFMHRYNRKKKNDHISVNRPGVGVGGEYSNHYFISFYFILNYICNLFTFSNNFNRIFVTTEFGEINTNIFILVPCLIIGFYTIR